MSVAAGGAEGAGELRVAAGWALVLRGAGAGFNLVFSFLLARRVGVEGAGVYYLALAAGTVASTVGRLGLENVLLRQVAAACARGARMEAAGVLRRGGGMVLAGSLVMAVVLHGGAPGLTAALDGDEDLLVCARWMALAVVPLSFVFVGAESLRGLGRLRSSILVQEVTVPLVGCLALLCFDAERGPVVVVWSFTLAVSAAALIGACVCLAAMDGPVSSPRGSIPPGRSLLRSGLPLMFAGLMTSLPQWTAIYWIGASLGRGEVGRLGMSIRLATLVSFALLAANVAGKRSFAALYARGDLRRLRAAAMSVSLFALFVSLPAAAALLIMPRTVLGWAGAGFAPAAPVLVVLVLGQLVNVATGSVGALLMMSGHERALRNSVFASTLVAIAATALLVPALGTAGAAAGLAAGWTVQNLLSTLYVRRYLGFYLWIPSPGSGE